MNCIIRELKKEEINLLDEFLYQAIFIPEGIEPPPRDIITLPELQVYIDGFRNEKDDNCLVVEVEGEIVGAVWSRIMNDFGHVDEETPSLAISIYKEYRGEGLGEKLMKSFLELLKDKGYKKVSLSVQKENFAYKLYLSLGFEVVHENTEDYIMVCSLII